MKNNILVTTVPFGKITSLPLDLLNELDDSKCIINPLGRKLKEDELCELINDYNIVIAGTESITRKVMEKAPNLKLIARVGIGLDSVDLKAAREFNIIVTYTPDAPSPAVAELTIAHMLNIMRNLPHINKKMHEGIWDRFTGERLANQTIGIIGTGRVGSLVLKHLQGFSPKKILVNDLRPDFALYEKYSASHVEKEVIYRESDIISLHIPFTKLTKNMITNNEIEIMKRNVSIVNTARGGIVNEKDLYSSLKIRRISYAALDVFDFEPYKGELTELDNCFLSCHMGSMTSDCRARMEIESTEEVVRFIKEEPLKNVVPEEEYENQ